MIHLAMKTLKYIAAGVLFFIGTILIFTPGPAFVFYGAGLVLLGYKPHEIKAKWNELKAWWRGRKADPSEELD